MDGNKIKAWFRRIPKDTELFVLVPIGFANEPPCCEWGPERTADMDILVQEMKDVAEAHTEAREVHTKFQLQAHRGDKVIANLVVKCRYSKGLSVAEDNSAAGVCAQLMRHNEGIMRTMVVGMDKMFKGYQDILEVQAQRIVHLEGRAHDVEELAQKTTGLSIELEQQAGAVMKQQEREERFWSMAEEHLAPHLFRKVAETLGFDIPLALVSGGKDESNE